MSADGAPPAESRFVDQAFSAAAKAYARWTDSWELAVHAAIAELFKFLADRRTETRACIAEGCGRAALARRDCTIERFTKLLEPGFALPDTPPPPVVADAIGGGIYEIVRAHALEDRLEVLPDAAAAATVVALAPFTGVPAATDVASSGPAPTNR